MRTLIIIGMSLLATQAMAATPWYAGLGVGATNYQQGDVIDNIPDTNLQFDAWEDSYQLFGGYQISDKVAVEFGYIDFGKTDDFDPNGQIIGYGQSFESSGAYINAQYQIPLNNRVSLDLSGGWLFGDGEARELFPPNTDGIPQKDSYNDNGVTLGLAFTWLATEQFYVRGSTSYYAVDYDNVIKNPWRIGVDLIWNF